MATRWHFCQTELCTRFLNRPSALGLEWQLPIFPPTLLCFLSDVNLVSELFYHLHTDAEMKEKKGRFQRHQEIMVVETFKIVYVVN
jgi:hypothetical protein